MRRWSDDFSVRLHVSAGAYFGCQELEVKRPPTTIDGRLGDARLTKDDRMLAF